MEILRLAKDVLNRKYHPLEYPVTLLGGAIVNNEEELNAFLLTQVTLFTYRSGFRQFARSDCSSDKGWGCLIRTCQMMIARVLTLHGQLDLSWFRDTNDDACPFSIHKFIRWVQNPNEAFDTKFWTPAQGCEAIRNTLIELGSLHMLNRPLTSYVCSNSVIIVEDVQFRLDSNMSVLILLPTVTGLHRTITQGAYLCLEQLLQIPHCCGMVAGVPNRSYFIIGVSGQRFCFLDPHTTQPAYTSPKSLGTHYETAGTLPAVAWNRIDSSVLLGFYISSHSEWDSFVDRLADVKKKAGGVELFNIATKAMLKGGPGARKPEAQHFYLRRKFQKSPTASGESPVSAPLSKSTTPTNADHIENGSAVVAAAPMISVVGTPSANDQSNRTTNNSNTSTRPQHSGGGNASFSPPLPTAPHLAGRMHSETCVGGSGDRDQKGYLNGSTFLIDAPTDSNNSSTGGGGERSKSPAENISPTASPMVRHTTKRRSPSPSMGDIANHNTTAANHTNQSERQPIVDHRAATSRSTGGYSSWDDADY